MLAELIGHYRVVATLGSGGMGVVWKAIDTRLNRPVALKAIRESDPENTEAVLRLRAEALAAASLDHPYICKIYELLETGSATIVVMEFVEGETLGDILNRCLPPLVDVLRYGSEIAEGLANAHARGIVHRDVKPSNVMVTPHGHIKLLDFGIARINSDLALTQSALTLPGNIPGTPQYMSPEQALGRPLDGRADLFSLGILLFRCLTGQLPFEGVTRDEYVQEMLAGHVRPLDELAPQVPEPVREIVKACLQKDPAFRPESAAVVSETLRRSAEALSTGTVPIAFTRSRGLPRWALQAGALAAVVGGLVLAALWWGPRGSDDSGPRTLVPAVTWPSIESGARVSPDGRWLSFISDRQNQSRIFVQNIDAGEAVAVAIQGTSVSHAWSPDSRELAVLVRQGQSQFLMVVPAFFGGSPRVSVPIDQALNDITVLRWVGDRVYLDANRGRPERLLLQVALSSRTVEDLSARWTGDRLFRNIDVSPDGRQVVLSTAGSEPSDLWIGGIDGSGFQRLTNDSYTDRYPIWVNADTIAFESNRGGQLDLWRISTATRKATQMTSGQTNEVPTGAAVDGSVIAFEEATNSVNLWRLDLTTGGSRQLTADALNDFWPSVSDDDGAMAFQRALPTSVEGFRFFDSRIQIARLSPDAPAEPQAVADGFSARLSGDGRWVAYYQRIPDPRYLRLIARNLATGEARTLSEQCLLPGLTATSLPVDFTEQRATWSRSDATLYFIVVGADGHEIHAADLQAPAAPRAPVFSAKGEIRDLRLSPDGQMLAFLVKLPPKEKEKPVFELRAHDLRDGRTVVVIRDQQPQRFLNLPGWSRQNAVMLQRAAQTRAHLFELELLEIAMDGSRRVLATVPDSVIPAVRMDPGRERLFVTRSVDGIHNVHAMSLRDGTLRQVTNNQSPGVSYSGIQPLRADALVFAREERKRDIWLVTTGSTRAQ